MEWFSRSWWTDRVISLPSNRSLTVAAATWIRGYDMTGTLH
jgi:hypothetical protein